jgi:hypothetical protein
VGSDRLSQEAIKAGSDANLCNRNDVRVFIVSS